MPAAVLRSPFWSVEASLSTIAAWWLTGQVCLSHWNAPREACRGLESWRVSKRWTNMLTLKEVLEILNYIYFRNTGNFQSQCHFLLQIVFSCIGWWGHEADASSVPSKWRESMRIHSCLNCRWRCLKQGKRVDCLVNLAVITVYQKKWEGGEGAAVRKWKPESHTVAYWLVMQA